MSFQLQLETISLKIELCASLTLQFEIGKTTEKRWIMFLGQQAGIMASLFTCFW